VHRTDVAVAAVSVTGTRRERPARLEAGAEWIVVGRSSTFTVRTAVAALDCRVADAIVSTDFMTTAIRVRKTLFILYTNNAQTVVNP